MSLRARERSERIWTRSFGAQRAAGGRRHFAVDMPTPYGTRVVAPATGLVTFAGKGRGREDLPQHSVYILDEFGYSHQLSHLQRPYVRVGQTVRAGEVIGVTGRAFRPSDRSETSPHLHYEIEQRGGQQLDILDEIKRASSLPR